MNLRLKKSWPQESLSFCQFGPGQVKKMGDRVAPRSLAGENLLPTRASAS